MNRYISKSYATSKNTIDRQYTERGQLWCQLLLVLQYCSFLRSCHAQNTKLRKKAGEKEQSCSSCFKSAKYTCLRCQGYFCIPCSVFENDERSNCQADGKQAVQSLIVSHVSEKLWRSKKRSNVMIQMNLAKIEIYRSKKNGVLQSGNQLWRENMVSNPGLSLSPYMK